MHNSNPFKIYLSIACMCYTMDDLKDVVKLQWEGKIKEGMEDNEH